MNNIISGSRLIDNCKIMISENVKGGKKYRIVQTIKEQTAVIEPHYHDKTGERLTDGLPPLKTEAEIDADTEKLLNDKQAEFDIEIGGREKGR
jgi:hypothetical protein